MKKGKTKFDFDLSDFEFENKSINSLTDIYLNEFIYDLKKAMKENGEMIGYSTMHSFLTPLKRGYKHFMTRYNDEDFV